MTQLYIHLLDVHRPHLSKLQPLLPPRPLQWWACVLVIDVIACFGVGLVGLLSLSAAAQQQSVQCACDNVCKYSLY